MDALSNAKSLITSYNNRLNEGKFHPEVAKLAISEAHALAAIAQAEQLKRIADMMESYLAIYGDPAVLSNLGATCDQCSDKQ